MIDIFTVVVPHALMAIAVWRLIRCDDLDSILPGAAEAPVQLEQGFDARRSALRRKAARTDKSPRA
jgi:hypothetical protein